MKPDKRLIFSKVNSNILTNFTWQVSSFPLIQGEESLNIITNFECLPKTKKKSYCKESDWRFPVPASVQCGKGSKFVKLFSTKQLRTLK